MKYQKEIEKNMLRFIRQRRGYTQRQAAALVGCTIARMDGWEKGKSIPPMDKLLSMCALYRVIPEQTYFEYREKLKEEIERKEKLALEQTKKE